MSRTCKFFTPSQALVNRFGNLDPAEGYEYDKPFGFSECRCDNVRNGAPFASCGHELSNGDCQFYAPEELRPVKSVVVTREDAELPLLREERVRLSVRRIGVGVPEYHITVETLADTETGAWSTPAVLHTVAGNVHGDKAPEVAKALFDHEVEQERASYPYKDAPLSDEEKVSYIETVVTV